MPHMFPIGDRTQQMEPVRYHRVLLAALLALPLILLGLDEVTPPTPHLAPLMAAAPALTAIFFGPVHVAQVSVVTVGCLIGADAANLQLSGSNFPMELATVVVISAIAALAAAGRERRVRQLARTREVAAAAQQVLLRPLPRRLGPLLISSLYLPAEEEAEIGGDLYAVASLGHGTRVIIGDAQGKGLAAVEEVGYVMSAFRRTALHQVPLAETAVRLERSMAEDIAAAARTPTADGTDTRHNRHSRFPEGFVTAVLVDIPDHGPRIEIVNCGHPPPLLLRGRDVRVLDPREPGLPLGLGNLGDAVRSPDTAEFHIGDTLLLYTDGLVEARDPAGAFYPLQERIRAGGWARLAPDELVETIRGDLERHVRRRLSDDVAIAAIQRADGQAGGE